MKAVLLGSGGWIPTATRETCCLYLRKGSDVLFLDAGTGLRHAVEQQDLLAGAGSVHILLSHFHLDHVVGLGYLPALQLPEKVLLWGPGQSLYGDSTRAILARLLDPPFFTAGVDALATDVAELAEGTNECGAFAVLARRQSRHSEPTFAFRVDDQVVYCSDTAADDENAVFAKGCSILFHEAWTAEGTRNADIHTSARQAGRIARRAEVDRLVLVHVNPLPTEGSLEAAARAEFECAIVGNDLLAIEVG
ncbi:MAG: MBL fold metallo-hydrolase [Actinobacteria bacterium]|nr:MBL fold metallo-hydrolase [Actinomycetota bacterium]